MRRSSLGAVPGLKSLPRVCESRMVTRPPACRALEREILFVVGGVPARCQVVAVRWVRRCNVETQIQGSVRATVPSRRRARVNQSPSNQSARRFPIAFKYSPPKCARGLPAAVRRRLLKACQSFRMRPYHSTRDWVRGTPHKITSSKSRARGRCR
jgi:hypothetical protein